MAKAAASDLKKLETRPPTSEAAVAHDRLAIMWKVLDGILADKLIAADAAANEKTKAEMVQIEVDSDLPQTPQESVVDTYYELNKTRFPGARAVAIERVRKYLVERTRRNAYDAYIRRLSKQYHVQTFLEPLRVDVATAGYPAQGAAAAPVTIIEFSDFECPYCGNLFPVIKMVEKNYGDKVRIVYRQFPLPWVHPYALKAAEASLCANQQNRFWDFHDALFANQRELTVDALKKRAVDLKLDTAAFNACLDSGQQAKAVQKDVDEGNRIGVDGTPTAFINGRKLYGTQAYSDFKEIIDDELRRKDR